MQKSHKENNSRPELWAHAQSRERGGGVTRGLREKTKGTLAFRKERGRGVVHCPTETNLQRFICRLMASGLKLFLPREPGYDSKGGRKKNEEQSPHLSDGTAHFRECGSWEFLAMTAYQIGLREKPNGNQRVLGRAHILFCLFFR